MKKVGAVSIVFLLMAMAAISIACGNAGPSANPENEGVDSHGWKWSKVKSPVTGRCYEVLTHSEPYQGYMGMSEIPCDDK